MDGGGVHGKVDGIDHSVVGRKSIHFRPSENRFDLLQGCVHTCAYRYISGQRR
jgi:hypothetical protein